MLLDAALLAVVEAAGNHRQTCPAYLLSRHCCTHLHLDLVALLLLHHAAASLEAKLLAGDESDTAALRQGADLGARAFLLKYHEGLGGPVDLDCLQIPMAKD